MGASRIASDFRVFEVVRQGCSLISGLLMQDFRPAGPDGIRRRGSHLQIELDALHPYRSFLVPVRPVLPITRLAACSP
jgi:hypothetical protein